VTIQGFDHGRGSESEATAKPDRFRRHEERTSFAFLDPGVVGLESRSPGRESRVDLDDLAEKRVQTSVRRRPKEPLPVAGERASLVDVAPQSEKDTALEITYQWDSLVEQILDLATQTRPFLAK
jgi:hypothetical protein